jgi:hypothetical protein
MNKNKTTKIDGKRSNGRSDFLRSSSVNGTVDVSF